MTTPRTLVAEALEVTLPPDVRVLPYARNIDTPHRSTVMVRVDEVLPSPVAPEAHRLYRYTLVLVSRFTDDHGPADDDLDALLEDVLYAIETNTVLPQWTRATRAQWLETNHPAYEVALEVTHKKEVTP